MIKNNQNKEWLLSVRHHIKEGSFRNRVKNYIYNTKYPIHDIRYTDSNKVEVKYYKGYNVEYLFSDSDEVTARTKNPEWKEWLDYWNESQSNKVDTYKFKDSFQLDKGDDFFITTILGTDTVSYDDVKHVSKAEPIKNYKKNPLPDRYLTVEEQKTLYSFENEAIQPKETIEPKNIAEDMNGNKKSFNVGLNKSYYHTSYMEEPEIPKY